jgi:hypothetical protein
LRSAARSRSCARRFGLISRATLDQMKRPRSHKELLVQHPARICRLRQCSPRPKNPIPCFGIRK